MKRVIVFLVLMFVGIGNVACAQVEEQIFEAAVVNTLLQQHRLSGKDISYWREWDTATAPMLMKKKLDSLDARKYLLIVFATNAGDVTQTSEFISETVVDRFLNNKHAFLEALSEMTFAEESFCDSISDHFDMFGNEEQKSSFFLANPNISHVCKIVIESRTTLSPNGSDQAK